VTPENGGEITVRMDTRNVGHMWPSGAAQDRRAWLEVIAYDVNNVVLFHTGDGIADDQDPEDLNDPNLFGMWDRTFKDQAMMMPAHFFWEVAVPPQSVLLNPPVTRDPNDPAVLAQLKTIDLGGTVRHWIKANVDPVSLCDKSPYE
jgi:hypothetical protein